MLPKLVLVTTDQETNAQVAELGVDFLELRVDLFESQEAGHIEGVIAARRQLGIPLLLTVRNKKKDGAAQAFADRTKWIILEQFIPIVDWVDIEMDSPLLGRVMALARKSKVKVVVSAHDFRRTPTDMDGILKEALRARPQIVKVAAWARSAEDVWRMVDFTRRNRKRQLVTMSLGPWGALSRLILPFAGSRWVYTFLGTPKAPGQVDIHTLKNHLNFYYQ